MLSWIDKNKRHKKVKKFPKYLLEVLIGLIIIIDFLLLRGLYINGRINSVLWLFTTIILGLGLIIGQTGGEV